jgi:hypothetical protein
MVMIVVPNNKLVTIPENDTFIKSNELLIESLKGKFKRDWFIKHAYFCLPLVIGNQYGFAIKSLKTFKVKWNGGALPTDTIMEILEDDENKNYQSISSHFGMGTITIQNRFTFRTPPGVNLMTINPPNQFIDGIHHMTGVIETDNLRRDFTFNLKITRPDFEITINKGDYIGCILPIPRRFVDEFELVNGYDIFTNDEIKEEQQAMYDFAVERSTKDVHKPFRNGRRYFKGEDVYGCQFLDHQNKL